MWLLAEALGTFRKLERDRLRREVMLDEKFFSLDHTSVALAKDIEHRLETRKRELTPA